MSESKWLRFIELPREIGRKTKAFQVTTKVEHEHGRDEQVLGRIAWYGGFRKFAFFPAPHTSFEQQCLRDLAAFTEQQTKEYRERKKLGAP